MMLVDAHHHLWDPRRRDYPWMTGPAAPLRRRHGTADLAAAARPVGVTHTVVVQAAADLTETEELLAAAGGTGPLADPEGAGLVAGVVGWVDLTAMDAADTLASLRERPGGGRLVGIRHQVHDEPAEDWLNHCDVLRGLRAVADAGLAYDLLVRARELPAARQMAELVEEGTFVVDHAAKPDIAGRGGEPWSSRLAELAELPNVACKLSGLVTEARWDTWTLEDLRPYAERVLELFGPDRLMFGSDWPVCTLAASYAQVHEAATALLTGLSQAERAAVLGGTAARVYGLDLD
jgi:L-fuconolactonase